MGDPDWGPFPDNGVTHPLATRRCDPLPRGPSRRRKALNQGANSLRHGGCVKVRCDDESNSLLSARGRDRSRDPPGLGQSDVSGLPQQFRPRDEGELRDWPQGRDQLREPAGAEAGAPINIDAAAPATALIAANEDNVSRFRSAGATPSCPAKNGDTIEPLSPKWRQQALDCANRSADG